MSVYIEQRKAATRIESRNHGSQPRIVSHIPPPIERRGGGGLHNYDHFYPFEDMKVGDSFWVPSKEGCTPSAVAQFAAKSGWKFMTRAQTEDGRPNNSVRESKNTIRGTRVWRIE